MRVPVFLSAVLAATLGAATAFSNDGKTTVYLDDLDLSAVECGYKSAQDGKTVDGNPLIVAGKTFERGVGSHSPGRLVVRLPKTGSVRFITEVGIADETNGQGHMEFLAFADGQLVWRSGFMKGKEAAKVCELDLTGKSTLLLELETGTEGYAHDHAVYGDARFEVSAEGADDLAIVRPLFVGADGKIYDETTDPQTLEAAREFLSLTRQIAAGPTSDYVAKDARDPASTILKTDRDPLDVALRRIDRLVEALLETLDEKELAADVAALADLKKRAEATPVEQKAERQTLFAEAVKIRRSVALKNPLLTFDDILFIKRHYNPEPEKQGNHMCDQFFGFHARPGGGLYVLKNAFSDKPEVVNVLENAVVSNGRLKGRKLDSSWGFLSPHLTYDGKTIYFAAADTSPQRHSYVWTEDNCYHLFRVNIDGTDLVQLTDGPWNDFDPYLMPNGRIVFISERRGGYGRCHARPCPSYTLHSMNADGSDIVPLSVHETNEWAPTVDAAGMIVYTRWDYVDRGFNQAHHPWVTFPDGRDARAIQGNYSENERSRPHFETTLNQVPDSVLLSGTASGHHTQNFGSVILIDPTAEDDENGGDPMGPIQRITPEQLFPEAEIGTHGPPHNFGQPYPLSEDFFLVVYDAFSGSAKGEGNKYGLYLLDAFGNKVLLHRDEKISCQWPRAVETRPVPPVVPHQTLVGIPEAQKDRFEIPAELPKTATIGVVDVYKTNRPFPEGTKIKELRIVQVLPKTTWNANQPWIGYAGENGARKVLGTVPVEEDGSVRFEAPTGVPFYFQALDENGVAVQTMRSAAYVHPGETLTCLGCHEGRHNTAQNADVATPLAFQRAPSQIKPDVPGSNPFNFPRLVQPILDRHCVDCHAEKAKAGETFELGRGPEGQYFTTSYFNLRPYVYVAGNGNNNPSAPMKEQPTHGGAWNSFAPARTFPGQFGANRSRLWQVLKEGHYDVKLSDEEKRALALWMDNNCDFFGAYEMESLDAQRRGEVVVPTLE